MADQDLEALRRRAFGVAYRMLGSVADADHVAQEALLRLTRVDEILVDPAAWITRVSTDRGIYPVTSAEPAAESSRSLHASAWIPVRTRSRDNKPARRKQPTNYRTMFRPRPCSGGVSGRLGVARLISRP